MQKGARIFYSDAKWRPKVVIVALEVRTCPKGCFQLGKVSRLGKEKKESLRGKGAARAFYSRRKSVRRQAKAPYRKKGAAWGYSKAEE